LRDGPVGLVGCNALLAGAFREPQTSVALDDHGRDHDGKYAPTENTDDIATQAEHSRK
jgi:hypothetical protein